MWLGLCQCKDDSPTPFTGCQLGAGIWHHLPDVPRAGGIGSGPNRNNIVGLYDYQIADDGNPHAATLSLTGTLITSECFRFFNLDAAQSPYMGLDEQAFGNLTFFWRPRFVLDTAEFGISGGGLQYYQPDPQYPVAGGPLPPASWNGFDAWRLVPTAYAPLSFSLQIGKLAGMPGYVDIAPFRSS